MEIILDIFGNQIVQQITVFSILLFGLYLFLRGRIRYDIVSLIIMLAVIGFGVLTAEEAFSNFGHEAIIIVASMFVMGEALVRSGVIDAITARMRPLYKHPIIGLGLLVVVVIVMSAFINNAGALAVVIPIAVHLARKSKTPIALFLLPLAFASHLGGFLTLIGTPRNIIISDFREDVTGAPFLMFDFFSVGGYLALAGGIFLILLAWRLILIQKAVSNTSSFSHRYVTEVSVSEESGVIGTTISAFEESCKHTIVIKGLYRDGKYIEPISTLELLALDKLIIKGDVESLTYYTEHFHLTLTGMRAIENYISPDDEQATIEVFVPPYSKLVGQTWDTVPLRERFGINFIGISRHGADVISELGETHIWPNDILLLRGRTDSLEETVQSMRLHAIAHDTDIKFGRTIRIFYVLGILITAITIASLNIVPLAIVFLTTSLILVSFNLLSVRQAYESIDQTVLILLAGMITLGDALQQSGVAQTIAQFVLSNGEILGPVLMLVVILFLTTFLSDFMNATASAVTMAPVAILIAQNLGVSIDPYLMAVAIGSSCAFLTPVGHESNAMVMRQGGYTFRDYIRVGLPLEILILVLSVPLILYVWPLY